MNTSNAWLICSTLPSTKSTTSASTRRASASFPTSPRRCARLTAHSRCSRARAKMVRMARSMDRPMRYFLAKRAEGPALIVADRIDAIFNQLKAEGLHGQFHPSYTRMVPAHYVVEIQLLGCPDPDPTYTRYFPPQRNSLSTDPHEIGRRYLG